MPEVTDYTALLSGSYWGGIEVTGRPAIVTFSFPTAAPGYMSSIAGFTPGTVSSFDDFDASERTQALAALGEWAAASNIVFVEVAPGQGDINFQKADLTTTGYGGVGGIGFYPWGDWNFWSYPSFSDDLDASGDVFMSTAAPFDYATLLHEIGHALGLKHPTEVVTNYGPFPPVVHDQVLASDDPNLTIMATAGGGSGHLQALDMDAVAAIYGAEAAGKPDVVTASTGPITYTLAQNPFVASWSWDAATQTLTQTGRGTGDTIRGTSVIDVIRGGGGNDELYGLAGNDSINGGIGDDTIQGGSGADYMAGSTGGDTYFVDDAGDRVVERAAEGADTVYAMVDYRLAANVETLRMVGDGLIGRGSAAGDQIYGDGFHGDVLYGLDGGDTIVSSGGADTVRGGNGNDTVWGGAGEDRIYGDAGDDWLYGETGNDTISGGTGNDYIHACGGKDYMTGGAGNDIFAFTELSDSATVATRDTISDFKEKALDLAQADRIDFLSLGDLEYIGNDAFDALGTGPGQVRWQLVGAHTQVEVDADANGTRDMVILLSGTHTLGVDDFMLL